MSTPCRRPGPFRLPFPLDTPIALADVLAALIVALGVGGLLLCGEALEMSHAWREGEALANEASLVARAKGWLPEFLRAPEEAP